MKWSFILYLPPAVSVLWVLAILGLRKHLTRAQLVLCVTMLLEALAMIVISVFFRGRAGGLFIYDFIFELVTVFCIAMFYVGICALIEPRGATLAQRRSFLPPLLFVLGLTVGAFLLGPRRYELMCIDIRNGAVAFIPGDNAWNFMLFWDHYLFPVFVILFGSIVMMLALGKFRVFARRYNTFYSDNLRQPRQKVWRLMVYSFFFVVLAITWVELINFRPLYYKYWLIACALLMSIVQFIFGLHVYNMNIDARYLAKLKQ